LPANGKGDAGLLYRRNRFFDPASGRFTQEDPIGLAGGLNLYGFASGDPITFSDPFGLCPPDNTNTKDCLPTDLGHAWQTLDKSNAGREVIGDYVKKHPSVDTDISSCQNYPSCTKGRNTVHAGGDTPQEIALGLSHEIVHVFGHAARHTVEYAEVEEPAAWDRALKVYDSFSPDDQKAAGSQGHQVDFYRRKPNEVKRQIRCQEIQVDCHE
jgi:RHS repeat-associated protein